jgi:hypothetical protein
MFSVLYSKYLQMIHDCTMYMLKGPKHEIFESGFFTQIRPVGLDDLGTGEKIWHFASWSLYLKVFATKSYLAYAQYALNNPKISR